MRVSTPIKTETSSTPCNLCGNTHVLVLAQCSRSGAKLRSVICKSCGLVWSDPFPHDPADFYANDYRLAYKQTYTPKPKHILRAGKVALARYKKIQPWLPRATNVLDVGSGGGEFVYLLKTLGYAVTGIEPNQGYAEYSKKAYQLDLINGFLQEYDFGDSRFDLISIWHVLEHTADPSAVLLKLRALLNDNGVLVVEVPNIEACCQAPKHIFHEAHLYNFNLHTLQRMAEKAGLKVESHLLSEDAGNVTVFFRLSETLPTQQATWEISGNADKIAGMLLLHTSLKHYLKLSSYRRCFRRLRQYALEFNALKKIDNNKEMLDQLYQRELSR